MIQKKMMFDGGVLRKYLLNKIGNKCPEFYEKRLAWIFPAWFLYFEMQAIKN
jgi:hypothetical protein